MNDQLFEVFFSLLTDGELISASINGAIPCTRIELLFVCLISIFFDVNERVLAGRDDVFEQSTFNHGLIS
jgi:hypothetical protein